MSKAQRIHTYNQAVAKLKVNPGVGLDTTWCTLPTEVVELVAMHLHPKDVARLRSVSSGWRAALWQERVVRASLRGIAVGSRVSELLLWKVVSASRHGTDAICDMTNLWAEDRSKLTIAWEPVLNRMNERHGSWARFINDSVVRYTTAGVWLSTMPPLSPHLNIDERVRKRMSDELVLVRLQQSRCVELC